VPEQLPTPLANACRAIARQVLEVLEVDFAEPAMEDDEMEPVERLSPAEMPMRLGVTMRRPH
jgi:hypothetical protein